MACCCSLCVPKNMLIMKQWRKEIWANLFAFPLRKPKRKKPPHIFICNRWEEDKPNKHKTFARTPPDLDCNRPVDVSRLSCAFCVELRRNQVGTGTRPHIVPGTLPRHTDHQIVFFVFFFFMCVCFVHRFFSRPVLQAHTKWHKPEIAGSFSLILQIFVCYCILQCLGVAVLHPFSQEIAGNRFLHLVSRSVCL